MKRVLIVCPYPHGKAASQRFRFEQYLRFFESWGLSYEQAAFWADRHWPAIYHKGFLLLKVYATALGFTKRVLLLLRLHRFDMVFIHREATPVGWPWWEWCAAHIWRKPLVFDFDDAIWLPNSSARNEQLVGKLKNHSKTAKILKWSKVALAGNTYLQEYASQFCRDVRLVPTSIDVENWHNPQRFSNQQNAVPIIGWTGTHSTLKQLIPLFPVLADLLQKVTFKLLIIADRAPEVLPAFAEFLPWNKATEIADLMRFDLGIMPLYDTPWEKGKCGFKALQYLALGIPAVVSAVGVNAKIVSPGIEGFLAEAMPPSQGLLWQDALQQLILDVDLRKTMGARGRERVTAHFSVEALRPVYREVLLSI